MNEIFYPPQSIETLLSNTAVRLEDCVRLALLYTLRYEAQGRPVVDKVDRLLASRGIPEQDRRV